MSERETKKCPQCGITNKMTKMTTWEDDRRVKMIGGQLFEMWESVCAGCGAYYRTGAIYLGVKESEEEPDPDESNDPTWEQLTECYVQSNSRAIGSLNKQVARLQARMREKKSCDHPGWIRDSKGDYKCTKCGTSLDEIVAGLTRIPSMSEKEPTVTVSLKSWDNFDRDLSLAEHQMVSALTKVRVIRGQIYKAMKRGLEGRLDENLVKVAELKESVEDLRKVADGIKAKGEKEIKSNDKDGAKETTN